MASNRILLINEEIQKELSALLRTVKDPRVQDVMISITRVETTPDLRYTKVYVSFLQNDKAKEAVEAFDDIINNMPESEKAFNVAKTALLTGIRTGRTTGFGVLTQYLDLQDYGLSEDREKAVFEQVQGMTLADVKTFQEKWIKGRKYVYGFLGRKEGLDMDFIGSLGPVTELSLEDIFGY